MKLLIFFALNIALASNTVTSASIFPIQKVVIKDTARVLVKNKYSANPKKAAILAIIPGLGQIYNREFWKAPIVYASLGDVFLLIT